LFIKNTDAKELPIEAFLYLSSLIQIKSMANAPQFVIELLKINCGAVQCSGYANELEALFYTFFFPTVFLILFIYILTGFIFRGGGNVKALKLLISVAAYAFIVFEGMFNLFISVSKAWWILTILLVGLYAFIRFLFKGSHGGGDRGGGAMPGIGGGPISRWAKGAARDVITGDREDLKKEIRARFKNMRTIIEQIKNPSSGTDVGSLVSQFRQYEGQAETAITELTKRGKIGGVNVENLGEKYWNELSKIQDEFASAKKKSHAS
jgi:hypothetical protein